MLRSFESTLSLTKWRSRSMCLEQAWKTGLFARCVALWLSHQMSECKSWYEKFLQDGLNLDKLKGDSGDAPVFRFGATPGDSTSFIWSRSRKWGLVWGRCNIH